jgi:hypothetical protein
VKRLALVALSSLVSVAACGGQQPSETPAPVAAPKPKPRPELGPQAGYCERLQPLLTKAVGAAQIGTEMSCLDVPGVTELGRFGTENAGEEGTLADCFDDPTSYTGLFDASESEFELAIADAFRADAQAGAGASLGTLVPWLPRVEFDRMRTSLLTARVTLTKARFVTLIGLASKLQGQKRERQCLETLCKPGYTYVNKALIGIPSLMLEAEDEHGGKVGVDAAIVSTEFSSKEVTKGSRELTSTQPVTLAIARSMFRTPQTERLCQFCGKQGQGCCAEGPACDGGLGCVGQTCVAVGGPDQPCDGGTCSGGATCVGGRCHMSCGRQGQPCCAGQACGETLSCSPNPENSLETRVTADRVELDGGFLGTNEDQTFGHSSCGRSGTRSRFAVTKQGSGRGTCDKAWWFDPKNEKDCRVAVHLDVSSFGTLSCFVEVFAKPPSKPDVCTR